MFLSSTEDDCLFVWINFVQQLFHSMFVTLLNLYSAIIEIRLSINLLWVNLSALYLIPFLILIVINIACCTINTEWN